MALVIDRQALPDPLLAYISSPRVAVVRQPTGDVTLSPIVEPADQGQTLKLSYTYWRDGAFFVGFLDDYPDDSTQGVSLSELEEALAEIYEIRQEEREHLMNMKKIMLIVAMMFAAFVVLSCGGGADKSGTKTEAAQAAQETAEEIQGDASPEHEADAPSSGVAEFIPVGYRFVKEAAGDLTKNGLDDRVLLVAKEPVGDQTIDDAVHGIIILFSNGGNDGYYLAHKSLELFGDRCGYAASCNVKVERGNLILIYDDNDGNYRWTFRYNDSDFELIGKDEDTWAYNSFIGTATSVNHLTKKRLVKTAVNAEEHYKSNFKPRYKETWEDVIVERLIKLSEVKDLMVAAGWQQTANQPDNTGSDADASAMRWTLKGGVLTISFEGEGAIEGEADWDGGGDHPEITFPWSEQREKVTKIVIESGATSIGDEAFSGFSNVTSVIIPSGVTRIGSGAFAGCASLASIVIPDGVQIISSEAFAGSGLTSITIPASVTDIYPCFVFDYGQYGGAFGGCEKLAEINVATDNPNYASVDGVLFNKDKTFLIQYPGGKQNASYTVPDEVKRMCYSAFLGDRALASITIGAKVEFEGSDHGDYFINAYESAGKAAGTYVLNNGAWSKE